MVIQLQSLACRFVHPHGCGLHLCGSCRGGRGAAWLCFLGVACASGARALGHGELEQVHVQDRDHVQD